MFSAANSDHAVGSASFQIVLAQPVSSEAINLVQRRHDMFRQELPALNQGKSFNIELGPQGPVVSTAPGVEFAFLRPDGTPAWVMRVGGNELAVDCNRYTRWAPVSQQAFSLLERVVRILAEADPASTAVAGCSLSFRDDFFWSGELSDYDLSMLFQQSGVLAGKAFSGGPVWHSHTAWFEDRLDPISTLIHLNVDGTTETPEALARGMAAQVSVMNLQTVRYREARQINEIAADFGFVAAGMQAMHDRNKSLLISLLTPSVASSIGLG